MALMTSMREKMHVVLWGLLAMFLLSMTIGGLVGGANILDQLVGNVNPQTTIARINGENIAPERFNNLVNQQIENARASGQNINDFQIQRARNTAWDNLVQDVLVAQEVKRLKITASDEEVIYHLENNPPPFLQQNPSFRTEDAFDWDKYREALANPQGNEWNPIESFMKTTFIPNYKLQKMLDESIIIMDRDVMNEFIKRNTEFTVTGAHITTTRVAAEESEPTQQEIQDEYERTKNIFSHDELRSITYVSWKKVPSNDDSTAAENMAKELAERAESGEDFSALANEFTMDPGNQGTKGGDLGWFKKGRMVKPFEDAAFSAVKNEIVGPVASTFGYHVIYVRDNRTDEAGDQEILTSHILIKIEISPTTLANMKRNATLFSYDAQDNGFDQAVSDHSLETESHEKLANSGFSIKGLGGLRSAVRYAFNSELNSVSDILENDQYFAVCTLDSIVSPGFKPLEEVVAQITSSLTTAKVKTGTLEEANKLLIKLSSRNMTLEELVEEENDLDGFKNESKTLFQGFTSIGRSNHVNGALLQAEPGEILGPLETNRGHAIIQLIEVADFDSTEFEAQKELLRKNIFNRKQGQYFQAWLDGLKDKADIIDNRKYYY